MPASGLLFVVGIVLGLLFRASPVSATSAPAHPPAELAVAKAAQAKQPFGQEYADGCGLAWRLVPGPNPSSTYNVLFGTDVNSSTDAWAVGQKREGNGPTYALIQHWDGSQWNVSASAVVSQDLLIDVSALSSNDVWAIGTSNGGPEHGLIEHWDGTQWKVTPNPSPVPGGSHWMGGIYAVSPMSVWAVGYYTSGFYEYTLVEHWDGIRWTVVPSPNAGGAEYSNELKSVVAVSDNDMWAVGNYFTGNGNPIFALIMHWDGANWTIMAAPGDYGDLYHVALSATNDVWAVGNTGSLAEHGTPLFLHWDGVSWARFPSSVPGDFYNNLWGVSLLGPNDAWAVGRYASQEDYTLTMHWDGTQWTLIPSPSPGTAISQLWGVDYASSQDVWAVGHEWQGNGTPWLTINERYSNVPCTPTPIPTLAPSATSTPGFTASPTALATGTPTLPATATVTSSATAIATATATLCNISFSDVSQSDYFYEGVRYLYCEGAISGYPDGTFRPYHNVTRGQIAKIVVLAEGWPLVNPPNPMFSDVPAGSTFYEYVETAANRGIIGGYPDGTFRPNANATRGQISKIVVLAQVWELVNPPNPTFSDVSVGSTFYEYVETAHEHGIVNGYPDGTFRPDSDATRGQLAKIVFLAIGTEH